MNKYQKLYEIFSKFPKATYEDCLKEISDLTVSYYNKHKSLYKKSLRKIEKAKMGKKKGKSKKNSLPGDQENILNPLMQKLMDMNDLELIREMCRKSIIQGDNDVRYLQILLSLNEKTGKLDYHTNLEQEWESQAKNMTMEELVNKVAILNQQPRESILDRRLKEAEEKEGSLKT